MDTTKNGLRKQLHQTESLSTLQESILGYNKKKRQSLISGGTGSVIVSNSCSPLPHNVIKWQEYIYRNAKFADTTKHVSKKTSTERAFLV